MNAAAVRRINPLHFILFTAASVAVVALWWAMLRSAFYDFTPRLAVLAAFSDLVISIPLAFWYFFVRRQQASVTSLLPLVAVGLVVGRLILPAEAAMSPRMLLLFGAAVETLLVAAVIVRLRGALANPDVHRDDPMTRGREILTSMLGSRALASVVMSELAIFYYALFSWKRPVEVSTPERRLFSIDRKSDWPLLAAGFILAIIFESIAMHLWLYQSAPIVALVLKVFDVYAILWFIADARALRMRSIAITDDSIEFRIGMRWEAEVPFALIARVEAIDPESKLDRKVMKVALTEDPTQLITLHAPVTFSGLYGLKKTTDHIALYLDDDEGFRSMMIERGLWYEPAVITPPPQPVAPAAPRMSREEWLRRRPDYIPEDDWIRFQPK